MVSADLQLSYMLATALTMHTWSYIILCCGSFRVSYACDASWNFFCAVTSPCSRMCQSICILQKQLQQEYSALLDALLEAGTQQGLQGWRLDGTSLLAGSRTS